MQDQFHIKHCFDVISNTVSFLIAEFLIPQAASNNAAAKYKNAKFRISQAGENENVPARNT